MEQAEVGRQYQVGDDEDDLQPTGSNLPAQIAGHQVEDERKNWLKEPHLLKINNNFNLICSTQTVTGKF
jgi:hypothetical protein